MRDRPSLLQISSYDLYRFHSVLQESTVYATCTKQILKIIDGI